MEYMSQFCKTKVNVVSTNGVRGVADTLFCVKGHFIAVEVKVGKDKLRPQQILFLNNVIADGGTGLMVHEDTYELFTNYILNKYLHNFRVVVPIELLPPKEVKAKSFTF